MESDCAETVMRADHMGSSGSTGKTGLEGNSGEEGLLLVWFGGCMRACRPWTVRPWTVRTWTGRPCGCDDLWHRGPNGGVVAAGA